jgi:hypothetical protein
MFRCSLATNSIGILIVVIARSRSYLLVAMLSVVLVNDDLTSMPADRAVFTISNPIFTRSDRGSGSLQSRKRDFWHTVDDLGG